MILLDTDHLTLLSYPTNPRCQALVTRMEASTDRQIGTTIISVEEQWRGWFAVIARFKDVRRQVKAYQELLQLHAFLSNWTVMAFDDRAADRFDENRAARGTHRVHGPQDCVHSLGPGCAGTLRQSCGFPESPKTTR
jgi:hypothetical protein